LTFADKERVAKADKQFCNAMLPRVSRTFAICIRLLPPDLEHPVLIAYLLCRIADTIEDTTSLSAAEKQRLLERFSDCIQPAGADPAPLQEAFVSYKDDDEQLASQADAVLREFRRLSEPRQTAIRPWVLEMCSGMADFVSSPNSDDAGFVTSLDTTEDLDRYCYYVAGTVGHMLTALFAQVTPPIPDDDFERMKALATSFGLGLQLTNIIKDVADDRQRGHNYVPRQLCLIAGIEPKDVQDGKYVHESREVVNALVEKAQGHLCDALEYSLCVPGKQRGIRAFCLTSLFFAVKTLRLTQQDDTVLDPNQKVKITRSSVRRTIITTGLIASNNALVKAYFRRLAGPGWWSRYLATRNDR
jgi:farnesyl-diphosphate farnesyltransferase